ncbi:MAG: hypothetical protein M1829_004293 [Trizodia sp. TS-e1964]|nr:MAG: hypothetical protein M1829_004293 [Trizodia sp. TS-e1964]
MHQLACIGSTSFFFRTEPGVVLKKAIDTWSSPEWAVRTAEKFAVERGIFARLGRHPRIVPFLGNHEKGILLAEASHGSLQSYIDTNNATMDDRLRWKFCLQVTEAIVYIHERGVVHSDMRPENYLVHETTTPSGEASVDIWLCDFGGANCPEAGLDGLKLPDDPFFDPRLPWESNPATDLFSLGSIIYAILTGFWPYRNTPPVRDESILEYEDEVNKLFLDGKFPDVSHIAGGHIIKGCWDHKYKKATELLDAIKAEMEALGVQLTE